jgi:predicted nucleic acid-binding protein
MVTPAGGLADTSVFVAREKGRPIVADIPEVLSVSFITVAELTFGVLSAVGSERANRLQTLIDVQQLDPIPVDGRIAATWAELRIALREKGRKLGVNDAWIAATAIAHGLPLVTQDDDYAGVPGLDVIRI